MLAVVKHAVDAIFSFSNSTSAHGARSTSSAAAVQNSQLSPKLCLHAAA